MVVFFGTSPRSAKFLKLITQKGLKIDLVVSEPSKFVGKKHLLVENPTVSIAKNKNIPFFLDLNDLKTQDNLKLGLILDYNKIIPNEVIDLFDKGIINIHFSKLPQYRGPAPVQYTILNGDREAWISYSLINEKLDAGKIIAQTSLPLDMTETTEDLYQKLITKSASETPEIINNYLLDRIKVRQQTGLPSYTQKLTTQNCQIDWTKSPQQIERLIRAAYPEPEAWTLIELKVQSAHLQTTSNTEQAKKKIKRLKILKAHLENGKLVLDQVQLEGKRPVSWKQFQEGYPKAKIINLPI